MTEEIEAHVLKKYEILQKLGKCLDLEVRYDDIIVIAFGFYNKFID
jgi:hypothetical protein